MVHDDGDEEDLEETEVKDSLVDNPENNGELELSEDQGKSEDNSKKEDTLPNFDDCESEEPDVLFRYSNNFPGGLGLRPHQIGCDGLRQELLRMESRLTDGLKASGSSFQKDIRRDWENLVRQAFQKS